MTTVRARGRAPAYAATRARGSSKKRARDSDALVVTVLTIAATVISVYDFCVLLLRSTGVS